jgi:hypothetical protein
VAFPVEKCFWMVDDELRKSRISGLISQCKQSFVFRRENRIACRQQLYLSKSVEHDRSHNRRRTNINFLIRPDIQVARMLHCNRPSVRFVPIRYCGREFSMRCTKCWTE